jgi:hypothetical protein
MCMVPSLVTNTPLLKLLFVLNLLDAYYYILYLELLISSSMQVCGQDQIVSVK